MSNKIKAVCDCWRNVLQTAYGSEGSSSGRMVSLTAICATVVGETIQEEVLLNSKTSEETSNLNDNDEEAMIIEEMYDMVPAHCRRWTMVSHALSIILDICPHHPALLSALLDICLSFGVGHQSELVLRTMFSSLLKDSSSGEPVICHPTHISFLSDLRERWVTINPSPSLSASTYISSLSSVLGDPSTGPYAWTSKSMRRYARETHKGDFPAFVRHLVTGLVETISRLHLLDRPVGRLEKDMRSRLMKWLDYMFDRLHSAESKHGDNSGTYNEDYVSVVEFLEHVRSLQLHVQEHNDNDQQFPNTIVSLTTYCLASARFSTLVPEDKRGLISLLRESQIMPTTYNDLVLLLFPLNTATLSYSELSLDAQTSPSLKNRSPAYIMRSLRWQANSLVKHGLHRLAASLWACALRHLERDWKVEMLGGVIVHARLRAIESLRDELVHEVEEAEKQCFGARDTVKCSDEGTPRPRGNDETEWEWEELVGAWVRKSPRAAQKRALVTPAKATLTRFDKRELPSLSAKKSWRRRQLVFSAHTPRRPSVHPADLEEDVGVDANCLSFGSEASDEDAVSSEDEAGHDISDNDEQRPNKRPSGGGARRNKTTCEVLSERPSYPSSDDLDCFAPSSPCANIIQDEPHKRQTRPHLRLNGSVKRPLVDREQNSPPKFKRFRREDLLEMSSDDALDIIGRGSSP
ncbi:hypothetical protein PUNSTDRAFT_142153 [Punctularia strigosozonata HHB-11173 SS5]|uniref:uncharacterized protein n=1 Tax=Punctularia strigosozonata (strain HHB-11173) TaxID=741275 RepID=UPI000441712E|nr:uncharacterized protein PUNSTDRAFT_142153 [Punctularia strigosozonata HHB-11173 SS5]EIN11952.1 hypothetical protein PUNSTDRAFT_142153 [Punctularia strigosozonata HHB-11173 SS5]